MKCIIVDDEKHARENLSYLLKSREYDVEIVGEAQNVDEAFILINNTQPDLVFLDISMPNKNGFDLIEMFDEILFHIVFITAYDSFALEAFKKLATAYILKPIDEVLLDKCMKKIILSSEVEKDNNLEKIHALILSMNSNRKLAIPSDTGIDLILFENIIYIESEEGYTILHIQNGKNILTSKRIAYYQERLPPSEFIKIHQSFLININYIVKYHKKGIVSLSNGVDLQVSRSMKKTFYDFLTRK